MKFLNILLLLGNLLPLLSQKIELTNNGDTLTVQEGGILYIAGGVLNKEGGEFYNDGTLYIADSIEHNAGNKMFIDTYPDGTPIQGTTILFGNFQRILGNFPIYFDSLLLQGTGKKILQQNAFIELFLDLNNSEFATQSHILTLLNPEVNSLTRQTGFISSNRGGYFIRNTNSTNSYLFPVGASLPTTRYRPIEIAPLSTSLNQFAVRFANTDPNNEGLNRNQKNDSLKEINPLYYHQIKQTQGNTPINLYIYYDNSDPYKETIAQWKPSWTHIGYKGHNDPTNSRWILQHWNNYDTENFALASLINKFSLIIPNVFTPNADNINDEFFITTVGLENISILIYDRWGKLIWKGKNNQRWNGTYNGNPVPEGVYFFIITAQIKSSNKIITRTGSLSIIR